MEDCDGVFREGAVSEQTKKRDEWQYTFDAIQDVVIILDGQFRLVRANRSALEFFRLPVEELIGRSCYTLMHGGETPPVGCPFVRMVETRKREEAEIYLEDRKLWVSISVDPVFDDEGRITEIIHIVRDITRQKKAEESLRETMEYFRLLIENSSDVIIVVDSDNIMRYVSPSMERILGFKPEELIGRNILEHMCAEDIPIDPEQFARHIYESREPVGPFELRARHKDGTWRWIETIDQSMTDKEGRKYIVSNSRDIGERREAEEALRHSEERYRIIFDESPIALMEVDGSLGKTYVDALRESGVMDFERYLTDHPEVLTEFAGLPKVIDVNKAAMRLHGTGDKEEMLRFLNSGVEYESMRGNRESVFLALAKGENSFVRESTIVNGCGESREISTSWIVPPADEKTHKRVLFSITDITEKKRAEEALQESEAKYRAVVEGSLVGVAIIQDNRFRFVNKRWCDIFGRTYDEVVDKMGPFDVTDLSPETEAIIREDMRALELGRKTDPDTLELTAVRKDGRPITIKLLVSSIQFKGRPAVAGTVMDITHEKALEVQLRQAQKMEAVGTLAGGIAHDFNNLLMTILGYVSLMLMDSDGTGGNHEMLKIIEKQIESGADLTKQLLGFARGGKYEIKTTDLNELLDRTIDMFGRTRKEISIHKRFEKGLNLCEVDQGQIEQVFLNLFLNAWHAMPGGGHLFVETAEALIDEFDSGLSTLKPGRYLKVSVTDTGTGMDEATRQRIFEPFFSTREMGRGSGLGLASAYGIVKNHGGAVNVYSEEGKGTTITVYLPASMKTMALKEKPQTKDVLRGTETVLLVDDQEDVALVGKAILTSLGYRPVCASGGGQALAIYGEEQAGIDLIILDMIMPGMSGEETYNGLKQINPTVKVLVSSGYSIEGQAMRMLENGCNGFIQKPFNVAELSRKIREILDIDGG